MGFKNAFYQTVVILMTLLFAYTAADKVIDFGFFQRAMSAQPIDHRFIKVLMWGVLFAEIIVLIILIIPKTRWVGLYSATFLMFTFTIYTGLVLANTFDKRPCACAGLFRHMSWSQHFIVNLVITILGITAICSRRNRQNSKLVIG